MCELSILPIVTRAFFWSLFFVSYLCVCLNHAWPWAVSWGIGHSLSLTLPDSWRSIAAFLCTALLSCSQEAVLIFPGEQQTPECGHYDSAVKLINSVLPASEAPSAPRWLCSYATLGLCFGDLMWYIPPPHNLDAITTTIPRNVPRHSWPW